jgi:hypothetical protein
METKQEKAVRLIDIIRRPNYRGIIGLVVIIASLGYIFLLFFRVIPEANKDILLPAAGYLTAKAGTIIDWHFGGSKDKSDSDKVEAVNKVAREGSTLGGEKG